MKDNFDDFDRDLFDLAPSTRKSYAPPAKRDTGSVAITDAHTSDPAPSFRIPPAGRDKPIRTAKYSGASFGKNGSRQRAPKAEASETVREYAMKGPFVKHVSVQSWPAPYSFYEKFVSDAALSHTRIGKKAPHVPFFSYIPQFTQLNAAQWAYYLYMKECAKNGSSLADADFSYVLLYIYEIINLEGIISPEDGAKLLGTVWILYRRIHPMLDKYMSEWIADYCLLYGVPLPKVLYPILPEIAARSTLKEFFADTAAEYAPRLTGKLMRLSLSDYDPSRSRYASKSENFASLIEEVFEAAADEQQKSSSGLFDKKLCRQMTVSRDAFCGSLCAASIKKKLILTLETPFRSPETRRVVTEMMKGAENIVRGRLGVKARLSAPVLEGKSIILSARTEEERAYLSFYESPSGVLSAEDAAKIELESWQNTELLAGDELAAEDEAFPDTADIEGALTGGDFSEEASHEEKTHTEEAPAPKEAKCLTDALGDTLAGLLRTAMNGASFAAACREAGIFADDAASRINESAMDFIGDVVLEASGSDYIFIEDYRDDV